MTTHAFRLGFKTNRRELLKLLVPHANPEAGGTAVSAAMLAIIDSGAVASAAGVPAFLYNANLLTTERTDFDIF